MCLLQARDEVITVLKLIKLNLALLEAKYGFVTPPKVLKALQRDAIQAKSGSWEEDIYEKPMSEVRERRDRVHNSTYMSESSDTAAQYYSIASESCTG